MKCELCKEKEAKESFEFGWGSNSLEEYVKNEAWYTLELCSDCVRKSKMQIQEIKKIIDKEKNNKEEFDLNKKIGRAKGKIIDNLSPLQLKNYDAIHWLLDNSNNVDVRRSGRTHLIIAVSILKALEYPGMTVEIIDHYSGRQETLRHSTSVAKHFIEGLDKEIRDRFVVQENRITFQL